MTTRRATVRFRVWNSETRIKGPWRNNAHDAKDDLKEMGGVIQRVELGSPVRISIVRPDP